MGPSAESYFALWAFAHFLLDCCGPQHWILLSAVSHCPDSGFAIRTTVWNQLGIGYRLDPSGCVFTGYVSMYMWQCIHMHLATYPHVSGHESTCSHSHMCVIMSTCRIWLFTTGQSAEFCYLLWASMQNFIICYEPQHRICCVLLATVQNFVKQYHWPQHRTTQN